MKTNLVETASGERVEYREGMDLDARIIAIDNFLASPEWLHRPDLKGALTVLENEHERLLKEQREN